MTAAAIASRKPIGVSKIRQVLRQRFGMQNLRPGQQEIIESVLQGRSTLAVMPTGAGKSLCYQLPAALLPGRTVVVSPLIALMKDQCDSLASLGIEAIQVNSAIGTEATHEAEALLEQGGSAIVMVTPERISDPEFLQLLARHPVSLLVVDEAHCVSQWGHDFRPAFLEIGDAWEKLGRPVLLGLTATAPEDVARDICEALRIPRGNVIDTSSYRPNLDLCVEPVQSEDDKLRRVLAIAAECAGSGIIYAATVKAAQAVHEALCAAGEPAGLYHGKLPAAERHAQQDAFMDGRCRVMVATNAFGLGIDKPDIRFVLHYQLPSRVEAYYQEAGRAGRDGQLARCVLLYLKGDKSIQQFFLAGRYPGETEAVAIHDALQSQAPPGDTWTVEQLQGKLAIPLSKLQTAIGIMRRKGIVVRSADGSLRLGRSAKRADLSALMDEYGMRRQRDRDALEQMVFYAQSGQCRWGVLLGHLDGESRVARCEHCDACRRIAAHEQMLSLRDQEAANDEASHADSPGWRAGDLVTVRRYGRGVVDSADGTQVTVRFADGVTRSFLPEFVSAISGRGSKRRTGSG